MAYGSQYDEWQDNRDETEICVGGKFDGCVHSRDESKVACGGWVRIYRGVSSMQELIAAVIGLIAGCVGSLIAPCCSLGALGY